MDALAMFLSELASLRQLLLGVLRPSSCIETTRFLLAVLRGHGIMARPLSCMVHAANAAATRGLERGDSEAAIREAGGHVVVIGARPGPAITGQAWNGHLALMVRGLLVDGSLDQASRPHHDLHLEPSWFPLPSNFPRHGRASYQLPGGGSLSYVARFHDTSYQATPAWSKGQALHRAWRGPSS